MDRPEAKTVVRRPMARAGLAAGKRREAADRTWALYVDGALDLDVLHRIVESAAAISEGRGYPTPGGETWFGTIMLTLDLRRLPLADPADNALACRLAATLMRDKRAERVINDRLYRELARQLGTDTPLAFEVSAKAVPDGLSVEFTANVEAPLIRVVDADGGR